MKEYIDKQELIKAIHDIYAGQLYCKEDMCNSEIVGYDCDDCIKGCISKTVENFKTYTQEEIVNEYAKEENGYLAASCEIVGYKKALDDMAKKINEYSTKHYLDCDGYGCQTESVFRIEYFLDYVVEQLKKGVGIDD